MREFYSVKTFAEATGMKERTVRQRCKEMRPFVGKGKRWPATALIYDGKSYYVQAKAFCEFMAERKELLCGKESC